MSLLSQASLVVVPSGYKEDVVYSVKPTDGSGDLTFTRASDGTRVNSQGLVERVPWNLAKYSEDLSNAVWTKLAATITTDATTAPNGTTTADKVIEDTTVNALHRCGQGAIAVTNGTKYTFSFYAKAAERFILELQRINTSGTVFNSISETIVNLTDGTISQGSNVDASSITSVGNGWFRITITISAIATGSGGLNIGLCNANGDYFYTGDGVSGAYIWGFQANEGSTAKPYFPTTDRLNVPRLDYSNGCPSLLLEPQRTNLVTYSEQFDNAAWVKSFSTITANATTSPDGTQNADKIIASTDFDGHLVRQLATLSDNTNYSLSCFAKADGYNFLRLQPTTKDGVSSNTYFNLATGAVATTGSGHTASIENFGNGWYRCTIVYNSGAGASSTNQRIAVSEADNQQSFGGDGTSGIYIWGAQLEAGSYPTSYIPTTSASVTRVADAASKTGITSLIGQTEGTLFLDFVLDSVDGSNDFRFDITQGTSFDNEIFIGMTNGDLRALIRESASNVYDSGNISATVGTRYKMALAYANNDVAFYINGTQEDTSSSATIPNTDEITIGNRTDSKPMTVKESLNQAALFKTRLTNAELASLTTL